MRELLGFEYLPVCRMRGWQTSDDDMDMDKATRRTSAQRSIQVPVNPLLHIIIDMLLQDDPDNKVHHKVQYPC